MSSGRLWGCLAADRGVIRGSVEAWPDLSKQEAQKPPCLLQWRSAQLRGQQDSVKNSRSRAATATGAGAEAVARLLVLQQPTQHKDSLQLSIARPPSARAHIDLKTLPSSSPLPPRPISASSQSSFYSVHPPNLILKNRLLPVLTNKWPELSKLPVNPPEVKLLVSNSLPRPPVNRRPLLAVSRSLTDTNPVPSLFVKSEDTRSRPSSSFVNSHSNVSFEKLLRISRLISDSSLPQLGRYRNPLRPTLYPCSKTPTWLPFMLSV
ncbi:hypothetical protein PTTG_04409 [Puccinia triticina 1-1 BBBD Race 1]|uniref:Uncharacterized protein n=1 Tax=Puccinia triticina (isolate 1-1 / race 1 (BBBD)) TaxID=630390 RepID=A0A180GN70_PUCT1|nr:hypothetical protein PTTG_04409 [Puccinia triticina 1-1 BBBD Race 1]